MKKIIITVIVFLFVLIANTNAQTNYTPTGNWRWINGNDTIQFFFKSTTVPIGDDNHPIIFGFHKYVRSGKVIVNTLMHSSSTFNQNLYSVSMFSDGQSNTNPRIDGQIKDVILYGNRYIIMKRINPTTMTIYLTYLDGVRRNGNEQGFTLPRNFTLTKY